MISFTVSIPTDLGFIGRSCSNNRCGRYFKVHADFLKEQMFCPYCSRQFSKNDLLTDDQEEYVKEAAIEKAREYMFREVDKMFSRLARNSSQNKHVKIKHTPINYRPREVSPEYQEHKVDSELICPQCNSRFQVLFEVRNFFKKHLGIDMLDGLTSDELLTIRRIFQKRHLYEHEGDKINDRYINMIPGGCTLHRPKRAVIFS